MQTSIALLSLAAAAYAAPQSVGGANTMPAPAGCSPSYSGSFGITAVNITMSTGKRDLSARQTNTGSGGQTGPLSIMLSGGKLTDSQGRVGNIVANHQFQFDPAPGQAGAIYTGGFSACGNGSLALGSSAVFYSCVGINAGGFFNLYDTPAGNQCNPVLLMITPISGSSSPSMSTGVASQKSDGQPVATTAASQKTDGQVVAPTAVSQKSDGQPVVATGASQKSDGQVVVPTAASQKSDGQVIIPTGIPMASVKSDGQVIVASVMQKSDGQIVAPASMTGAPVAQKSDGQIVATPTGAPVAQKTDGQVVAGTGTGSAVKPTSTGLQVTSSASSLSFASQVVAAFAGLVAAAFL